MKKRGRFGFTLIEVIVTLVLSAIAMAALVPFMGRVFLLSHETGAQLQGGLDIRSAMEDLVARNTNAVERIRVRVGAQGGTYLGQFVVVDNRYVAFPGNAESVVVSTNNLLKVTLRNPQGETLTRLFTNPL
jgi:prepilin-type N-terminal cleavage/methylation domain-containing protein